MIFGRFLTIFDQYDEALHSKSCEILKILVEEGLLKNNREFGVIFIPRSVPLILRVIRSMTQLEKLSLSEWKLTLTEDVPKLFRSCPKLTELRLKVVESQEFEMNEELQNELRAGFLRLRLLELEWYIDSWPAILEMFT